jgi:peptidoglycan hydrolase-like protein with peptidoglycan-binding domain
MPVLHLTRCPSGTPTVTLRLTSPYVTNPYVRIIQTDLGLVGHPVTVDGIYGPETANAVRAFTAAYSGSTTPRGTVTATDTVTPAVWCLISTIKNERMLTSPSRTITVQQAPPTPAPLDVPAQALPKATLDITFSARLGASGGTKPYTWYIVSGSLPPGIYLRPDGLLYGKPTILGNYTFTVAVKDAELHTATRTFTIAVSAPHFPNIISEAESLAERIAVQLHLPTLVVDLGGAALAGLVIVTIGKRLLGRRKSSSSRKRS